MRKPIDITGKRYGRLVVLDISHRDKFKQVVWDCICDCGNHRKAVGLYLHAGSKKSCGCLEKENKEKILGGHPTHSQSNSAFTVYGNTCAQDVETRRIIATTAMVEEEFQSVKSGITLKYSLIGHYLMDINKV